MATRQRRRARARRVSSVGWRMRSCRSNAGSRGRIRNGPHRDDRPIRVLLPKHLSDLRNAHPETTVEVSASTVMANLARREADIALRPTPEPPELLLGA